MENSICGITYWNEIYAYFGDIAPKNNVCGPKGD